MVSRTFGVVIIRCPRYGPAVFTAASYPPLPQSIFVHRLSRWLSGCEHGDGPLEGLCWAGAWWGIRRVACHYSG